VRTAKWTALAALAAVAGLTARVTPAASAGGPGASATPRPHSDEELLRAPAIQDAALSPDGRWIALARRDSDGSGDRIVVVDATRVGEPGASRVLGVGGSDRIRVEWLLWANAGRLLAGIALANEGDVRRWGTEDAFDDGVRSIRRIVAVDPDGSRPVLMFGDDRMMVARSRVLGAVVDTTPEDPATVVMAGLGPAFTVDLYRVNVDTGAAERLAQGNRATFGWVTEQGRPALRYDAAAAGMAIVYAADGRGGWAEAVKYKRTDAKPEWAFVGDAPGPGLIYVQQRRDGEDKASINVYDTIARQLKERVLAVPDYDLSSALVFDDRYHGAGWIADRTQYRMADPKLQPHVEGLAKYFGEQVNVQIAGMDRDGTRLLLYAHGPAAPGDWYVYDVAKRDVKFVEASRPWLEPERLPRTDARDVRTRDGATIRAYLTHLPGHAGPRPLVLMPHGGPESRDQVTFDTFVQVLAARGWLVVQPNFRGSFGYGRAFAEAGWKQWGRRMQDDLDDTVADLVAAGLADPRRVAIVGSSYGGYAALAGAAFTPDRYRAAVSIAGVSDLVDLMQMINAEEGKGSPGALWWAKRIGDLTANRAELERWSPARAANAVRIPVLLAHGTRDGVVPLSQSQRMKARLEQAGRRVELLEFTREGHGGWSPESEQRLTTAVAAFLEPHLR
jgi:dipeptidyl aminopeptidase/acylaminoacyl peptidase